MVKVIMHGCNGKMGRVITGLVSKDENVEIVAGVDAYTGIPNDYPVFESIEKCGENADVVVDFSNAAAVDGLLDYCASHKLPVVLCTTGLSEEQLEKVEETAKTTAVLRSANMSLGINLLMKLLQSKERKKREKKEIGIAAVRGGTIVGEHEVIFAGTDEVIEFKHTAYSRTVFAKGAVEAAKFLADKPAGMYDMGDVIGL